VVTLQGYNKNSKCRDIKGQCVSPTTMTTDSPTGRRVGLTATHRAASQHCSQRAQCTCTVHVHCATGKA